MNNIAHAPVLLEEAIELLKVESGKWYLDGTFGRGGHSRKILELGGSVLGFDHDASAIEFANREFTEEVEEGRLKLYRENFEKADEALGDFTDPISGILIDAGVSSPQLNQAERGFSFMQPAPLDMRMDKRLQVTAKDLVNGLSAKELEMVFSRFAQVERAKTIADAIVRRRATEEIETTADLADIVMRSVGGFRGKLHPATKVFLALRIAVNDELGSLERALPKLFDLLADSGRLVVISFHEGEDRIVKHTFKALALAEKGANLMKTPMIPTDDEVNINARSRSAKLRAIEKSAKGEQ